MTREQLKDAIVRPLELFGASASPALVNRILNDIGTDPDSLPLMQHALLRTWENAKRRAARPPSGNEPGVELQIANYEKIGGLQKALSRHADEAFAELGGDQIDGELYQRIAQRLFLLLCRQTGAGVIVRNPIRANEAAAIAGVPAEDVMHVAATFAREGRNFITSSSEPQWTVDSTLDISHESLIRNWDTLKAWIKVETKYAADYAWLLQAAERWQSGADLFHGANLRIALAWQREAKPSAGWAARYGGNFNLAIRFLEKSRNRYRSRLIWGGSLPVFSSWRLFFTAFNWLGSG
jgi:hypothetical protein